MTASWWPQSWRRVLSLGALALVLQGSAPQAVVECTLDMDPAGRRYSVVDHGNNRNPRWWLALRTRTRGDRVVEMPLADATVDRTAGRVRVSSASKNGGLAVEIVAATDKSVLDVFVNFELEVNVWRDLSPEVEQMNTEGKATASCRVVPEPALIR